MCISELLLLSRLFLPRRSLRSTLGTATCAVTAAHRRKMPTFRLANRHEVPGGVALVD